MEVGTDTDINNEKKIIKILRANRVELACQTTEKIMKLYYKYLDKQRDVTTILQNISRGRRPVNVSSQDCRPSAVQGELQNVQSNLSNYSH